MYTTIKNQAHYNQGVLWATIFFNESIKAAPDSAMAKFSRQSFLDYVADMQFSKNILERLGEVTLTYPSERGREVMLNLAKEYNGRVPDMKGMNLWLGAFFDDITSISYKADIVVEGIKETAKDLGKFAVGGLLAYAAGALVILYIATSRGKATA